VEEMTGRIFPFLQEVVSHVDVADAKCEKVVVGGRDVSELYSEIAWSLEIATVNFKYDSKSSIDDSNHHDDPDGTDDLSDASSTSKKDFLSPEARSSLCQIRFIFGRSLWLGFVDESRVVAIITSRKRANDICAQFLRYVASKVKQYPCWNAILQSVHEAKDAREAM